MKIVERIKSGVYKGWTIRKSKHGWYSVYSSNGICQNNCKLESMEDVKKFFELGDSYKLLSTKQTNPHP